MPNPFDHEKKPEPENQSQQVKIGICAALILVFVFLVGVLVKISHRHSAPEQSTAETLTNPALESPTNPPALAEALPDSNPTMSAPPGNLPEDISPSGPPVMTPVSQPIAAAPSQPPTKHRPVVSRARSSVVVVKAGDTLWRIAKTHHTTVNSLKTANHLKGNLIRVGQKLRISSAKHTTSKPRVKSLSHHRRVLPNFRSRSGF